MTSNHIDFHGINQAALRNARSLLPALIPGGKFRSLEYVVRNPTRNDRQTGSFSINYRTGVWKDFASGEGGGDIISLVAHIRQWNQGEAARELADRLGVPLPRSNSAAVAAKVNGHSPFAGDVAPRVCDWGDCGPPVQPDEVRRHVYRGSAKIKIKYHHDYKTWYRVGGGWQAKKPENFQPVPYVTAAIDPFDQELVDDQIFWPEGEKDVDSLSKANLPAFTFGGVGDGLPDGIEIYLSERHIVILVDSDDVGRKHGEKKRQLLIPPGRHQFDSSVSLNSRRRLTFPISLPQEGRPKTS